MTNRDRSSTPATTSSSAAVIVWMDPAYGRSKLKPLTLALSQMGRGKYWLELLLREEGLVPRVGQALDRVGDREPQHLVALDPGTETAAPHLHHPVAGDLVAATPVDIGGATYRAPELAAKPCLFPDLAQRAVLGAFVRFDLALGQSPVVVPRSMDDCNLRLAGSRVPADNSAGRSHHPPICDFQDLVSQRCSLVICNGCAAAI